MCNQKPNDIIRRVGRFKLSIALIDSDPEEVFSLMGNFIIFRAESMYHEQVIEYIAVSKLFEAIQPGGKVPWYNIIIARSGDHAGSPNYEFSAEKI